ncbi:hypothetical protein FD39_GL000511 [Lactobacillus amylolyticus DSM 11664]|uniref:Uncharacterized protein n=1 Tax=Lactobacillus amylolyticus DSM 11664 TaxID=585524 RepID=D4YU28_9LACO|nr:hypothetical protein [Lactobacillus amylolyticus]EFG55348.1 hypothetical protein HMPREF0493_1039 [Lactobacillus amylolyticus DSM 11664]KRL18209.1 hypothetical protein FD39_GL000511 [Lactobacillus amylolyticus DSM 11664]
MAFALLKACQLIKQVERMKKILTSIETIKLSLFVLNIVRALPAASRPKQSNLYDQIMLELNQF